MGATPNILRKPRNDTHPDAARVQLELLRAAGPEKRLKLAISLSSTAMRLSRESIARTRHLTDPTEIKLEWARAHYGDDLAQRVRDWLDRDARE
jgi:hypothetical protein